jgi:glycine hydroxymethyltransferase
MLVDLRPKKVTGRAAERALDRANMTCNKNAIPFDTEKPAITSGIRLGSPAGTTRGFGPTEFGQIGKMIAEVLDGVAAKGDEGDPTIETSVRNRVLDLCHRFPIYF